MTTILPQFQQTVSVCSSYFERIIGFQA
ncbi:TPA: hypothetical protein ANIA_11255 [Aspergillus nidulans FGSC A4]|uniref:Uncharacterized protein n=1 Tax=Emericella nidulans (strain FGSC A4 / ATCC 38163 / CBS 112.46 / NRRL 194 / M139) TaxID=227321 RepID=C8VRT5_EMENI|nr:TPA: hypothetical protein ANIA_11256 [Aspergillus nidulans FGSC A4]CBF90404.1 TPA: hypothetical protein ANIA_11255 [Aspergillus nidulans FGSC A4]